MPVELWPREHQELLHWLNAQLALSGSASSLAWPADLSLALSSSTTAAAEATTAASGGTDASPRVKSLHADLRTGIVLIDLVQVRRSPPRRHRCGGPC